MVIHIDTRQTPAAITLQNPTDFTAFHVVAQGNDEAVLAAAVLRIGSVAGPDHVFVDRVALERLAGDHAREPEWQRSLESMLRYAASKGWTNETGAIRAHVEHTAG